MKMFMILKFLVHAFTQTMEIEEIDGEKEYIKSEINKIQHERFVQVL